MLKVYTDDKSCANIALGTFIYTIYEKGKSEKLVMITKSINTMNKRALTNCIFLLIYKSISILLFGEC